MTEFGRALTAKAGTIVARVEYTKVTGGRPIAITHAGVQVATRTIFAPEAWPLRVEIYDRQGRRRDGGVRVQDVAGPACFTGDMLAVGRELPFIRRGDLVAVPDTGGYYFSTHFSYNALPPPRGVHRWRPTPRATDAGRLPVGPRRSNRSSPRPANRLLCRCPLPPVRLTLRLIATAHMLESTSQSSSTDEPRSGLARSLKTRHMTMIAIGECHRCRAVRR